MFRLRFTTLVEAPLTVAFDVARTLGRPWRMPLDEVVSVRPVRDVHAAGQMPGGGWITHSRRFSATGAGTQVDEQVDWDTGLPGILGGLVDQLVLRRRVLRAMQSHLDAYAAAAARRALDVLQVVGAAIVDGDRVLVARRSGGPFDGCWEFPGGKVERGESDLSALVREIGEELDVAITPQAFVGEVLLDGVVGGGAPERRPCGSGGRGSPTAGCPWRTSTPSCAGWAPTSSTTSPGSRPTGPCCPTSAPCCSASDHPAFGTESWSGAAQLSVQKAERGGRAVDDDSSERDL